MPDAAKSLNMHSGNKTNRSLNSGVPRLILLFGRPRVRIQAVQHLTSYKYSAIPCFTAAQSPPSSAQVGADAPLGQRLAQGTLRHRPHPPRNTQIQLPSKNGTYQAQASSSPVSPKFLVLPGKSEKQAPLLQAAQPRAYPTQKLHKASGPAWLVSSSFRRMA